MRIAGFNANSIRSRLAIVLDWMQEHECDVLCVQETKVSDSEFPVDAITQAGYYAAFTGQKAYNGVAIISKEPLQEVVIGVGGETPDAEARVMRAIIRGVAVVNTYIPQGTSVDSPRFKYKIEFMRGMRDYFARNFSPQDPVVWLGDFNVAREPQDVYDPEGVRGCVCYHPAEHEALDYVMEWGFADVFRRHHPGEANQYTFWDYRVPNAYKRRLGWRLDYILATHSLADKSINCWIDTAPRVMEKPSDHTFIAADFDVG